MIDQEIQTFLVLVFRSKLVKKKEKKPGQAGICFYNEAGDFDTLVAVVFPLGGSASNLCGQ